MEAIIIALCGIPAMIVARTIMRTWEKFHG